MSNSKHTPIDPDAFSVLNKTGLTPLEQAEEIAAYKQEVKELVQLIKKRVDWSNKYPSTKIYSMENASLMMLESDQIDNELRNACKKYKDESE